jgi:hypothetical protein
MLLVFTTTLMGSDDKKVYFTPNGPFCWASMLSLLGLTHIRLYLLMNSTFLAFCRLRCTTSFIDKQKLAKLPCPLTSVQLN